MNYGHPYEIREIRNHIITTYDGSCIAYNNKTDVVSDDEIVEECISFFYYEKLGWCGCGDPNTALLCVKDYLNIIYAWEKEKDASKAYFKKQEMLKSRFGVRNVCDSELLLCLAYSLDAACITEHGTSISGAWLTDEGKMFMSVLNMKNENFIQ